ncbi:MAG: ribosome silencing factor [Dehalococcoidia bacterium]|jgi:ribosome-associated protein
MAPNGLPVFGGVRPRAIIAGRVPGGGRNLQAGELAQRVVELLSDKQATDIILLDIGQVASFADYFVIASAANRRQMQALVDTVDSDLSQKGVSSIHREGDADSGWILLDLGDVIVHLFDPETRAFYKIEELWSRGVSVVRFQ